jgi:hypothetical protein
MPTAHPIITPRFELEPPLPDGALVLALLAALAEGFADGVIVINLETVTTPAGPEETLRLTEVMG